MMSYTTRVQNKAVNMLTRMPKVSVVAKPFTGPVPYCHNTTAVMAAF